MLGDERIPEIGERRLSCGRSMTSWFGIGAPFRADGNSFASPDQLRTARAEVAPSADR